MGAGADVAAFGADEVGSDLACEKSIDDQVKLTRIGLRVLRSTSLDFVLLKLMKEKQQILMRILHLLLKLFLHNFLDHLRIHTLRHL